MLSVFLNPKHFKERDKLNKDINRMKDSVKALKGKYGSPAELIQRKQQTTLRCSCTTHLAFTQTNGHALVKSVCMCVCMRQM